MDKNTGMKKYLDYETIERATKGEYVAIEKIMQHYSGYIARLSMRPFYDEWGMVHYFVDEELKGRLETKLLEKILEFDPT